MNWRYKIDGDEIILNAEEHQQVQDGIAQGAGLITLRGGHLGINPKFVRKFTATDSLTDEQLDRRTQMLALEDKPFREMTPEQQAARRKMHDDFMQRFAGKKIDWKIDNDHLRNTIKQKANITSRDTLLNTRMKEIK